MTASALDELFGVAPEAFIEKRKALAATMKGAEAKTMVEQKKPTRGAFLLNRLVREYPEKIARAGEDWRVAQDRPPWR